MMATTDPARMTVVFATYQSIAVVAEAQRLGLPDFDLIICDEAHRTTGATLPGVDESEFVPVHDNSFLGGTKRLYMTATPRIYDDSSKAKAGQAQAVLASMDNEKTYGPELHRLGFGQAVARSLLTDYKVLVLAVDEHSVSQAFQTQLADADSELRLDDAAKIIGCWNGLAKRGHSEHTFATDPAPMARAVAFSGTIKNSKAFTELFAKVIADYADTHDGDPADGDDPLVCTVDHVDGTYNVLERNHRLDWLKADPEPGRCRILSNARCLSEGVNVPALDAVMFLNPRKSVVDVVQSVGRVMRRAPGKKHGYIILPIGILGGQRHQLIPTTSSSRATDRSPSNGRTSTQRSTNVDTNSLQSSPPPPTPTWASWSRPRGPRRRSVLSSWTNCPTCLSTRTHPTSEDRVWRAQMWARAMTSNGRSTGARRGFCLGSGSSGPLADELRSCGGVPLEA